jgi:hypothetical protein
LRIPLLLIEAHGLLAAQVCVRHDQVGPTVTCPPFDCVHEASADTPTSKSGLNGKVVDTDAPKAHVALWLYGCVLNRLLDERLHLADRLTVYLRDKPGPVGSQRLSQLGFSSGGQVAIRDLEALRVEANVLLGKVDPRQRQSLAITGASRSHNDVHGASIVEAGDFHIKPLIAGAVTAASVARTSA